MTHFAVNVKQVCKTSLRSVSTEILFLVRQAVEACSAAIARACSHSQSTHGHSISEGSELEKAVSQRAAMYEHLEAYELSLQDYQHILKLQPRHAQVMRQLP